MKFLQKIINKLFNRLPKAVIIFKITKGSFKNYPYNINTAYAFNFSDLDINDIEIIKMNNHDENKSQALLNYLEKKKCNFKATFLNISRFDLFPVFKIDNTI